MPLLPYLPEHPHAHVFIHCHLLMQLNDVRSMLRLPLPDLGLTGGCNFAAPEVLFNVLVGAAKKLYSSPLGGDGERFKALLVEFYPWDEGYSDQQKKSDAGRLWAARNHLAKTLGIIEKKGSPRLRVEKSPLSDAEIQVLETTRSRPAPLPAALRLEPHVGEVLSVSGLYWGVLNLLRNFVASSAQLDEADARLAGRRERPPRGQREPCT